VNLAKTRDKYLRETVHSATLPGGTRLLVLPMPGKTKRAAVAGVPFGSIDLSFTHPDTGEAVTVPAGVAHFLEHQLFKKAGGDLSEEFARHGANDNAVTDLSATYYHFAATEAFEECLDVLLRIVLEPYFTEENVEREKPIVESEIRMGEEVPDTRTMNALLEGLYHAHPVRIDVPGTVESIRGITSETLALCHRSFYAPSELVVVVAGDVEPQAVARRAREALARLARPSLRVERRIPAEPRGVARKATTLTLALPRPKILLGWKDTEIGGSEEDVVRRETATGIALDLLFGKGSALYTRLYDRGLIDDSFSFAHFAHTSFGFTVLGGDTDEPERVRDEVLRGVARARKDGVRKREIERMRRKYLGRYVRSFDDPESAAFAMFGYAVRGVDPLQFPKWLSRVSARVVVERIEGHLDEALSATCVAMPREDME